MQRRVLLFCFSLPEIKQGSWDELNQGNVIIARELMRHEGQNTDALVQD